MNNPSDNAGQKTLLTSLRKLAETSRTIIGSYAHHVTILRMRLPQMGSDKDQNPLDHTGAYADWISSQIEDPEQRKAAMERLSTTRPYIKLLSATWGPPG